MKNFICFCALSSLLLMTSCHKDEPLPQAPSDKNIYSINPNSSAWLQPYQGKDKAVFEDSLGNILTFKVNAFPNTTESLLLFYSDANAPGGQGTYTYFSNGDRVILTDEAGHYTFNLDLFPQLDGDNPDSYKNFDALYIKMKEPSDAQHSSTVMYKVIDFKDDIQFKNNFVETTISEPSRTFLGVTFKDVEHMNYSSSFALVYINKTYGMVAFTDYNNTLWRLKI